jgi:hypothetical protein
MLLKSALIVLVVSASALFPAAEAATANLANP